MSRGPSICSRELFVQKGEQCIQIPNKPCRCASHMHLLANPAGHSRHSEENRLHFPKTTNDSYFQSKRYQTVGITDC